MSSPQDVETLERLARELADAHAAYDSGHAADGMLLVAKINDAEDDLADFVRDHHAVILSLIAENARLTSSLAAAQGDSERYGSQRIQDTIRDCLTVCEKRGWSLHWTARGAYLHLEASELIEAWRGKGTSTVAEEAGDVLLVLFSILGASGVPWSEAIGHARLKLSDLFTRPRYAGEEFSAAEARS